MSMLVHTEITIHGFGLSIQKIIIGQNVGIDRTDPAIVWCVQLLMINIMYCNEDKHPLNIDI